MRYHTALIQHLGEVWEVCIDMQTETVDSVYIESGHDLAFPELSHYLKPELLRELYNDTLTDFEENA